MSKYKLKDSTTDAWSVEALCDIINKTPDLSTWPVELKLPLAYGWMVFTYRKDPRKKVDAISVMTTFNGLRIAVSKADMIVYTPELVLSITSIDKFNSKFDQV